MPDQKKPPPHARSDDHDSPWKEALELYFRQAVALLAPDLHRLIAWSIAPRFLGQGVHFTFPVVELDRWLNRWDELESLAPSNPFAVIIMAQLLAQRHRDKSTRLVPLKHLAKRLFEYGYSEQQTNRILKLVDVTQRILAAHSPQLKTWALNLMDATSLDDVFRD